MRILHVEDSPHDAELTRIALSRSLPDSELVTVATLSDAWRTLDLGARFDVLLADLHLSDGSGLELVAEVRTRELSLAVVILTGSGDERTAVAALKVGADDYLVKQGDYLALLPEVLRSAVAYTNEQAARRRPIRVLYVEHNPADVDLTLRHLQRHAAHIQIVAAHDAPRGLERLRRGERFDVLLLDYRLSGLDALEFLEVLRNDPSCSSIPVVFVTGHGDELVAAQALRSGASDYLVKRTGYLYELVSVLESAHHRAQLARQVRALDQAISARELGEQALASISQGVLLTDSARRVLYANPALLALTGHREAELLGQPCSILLESEENLEAQARMLAALDAARPWTELLQTRCEDGRALWIRISLTPVLDPQGVTKHFVGVLEDVTGQRQLEDQFRQAQKLEAIGQLSGGIAHDFNNLLTVITGHIGLLRSRALVTPAIEDSIDQISEAADRAVQLTRQLLTFSRKQFMTMKVLDLTEAVERMVRMLSRLVGEHIQMSVVHTDRPTCVRADEGMIDQVLVNLCVNARDAMPDGGHIEIGVHVVPCADLLDGDAGIPELHGDGLPSTFVCLRVSDTGCGIAPEVQERIFEPFFTTKGVGLGTGLGLPTVHGITHQHGGFCRVHSVVGQGTRFEVYLPGLEGPLADTGREESSRGETRGGSETVLLVEDDPSVSALIRLTLQNAGYRILAADTGRSALALWEENGARVNLLLTDLVMPDGVSGSDLADRLTARRPRLPVVFTSGYSSEVAGRDLGASELQGRHFLAKPFTGAALLGIVRRALDAASGSGAD